MQLKWLQRYNLLIFDEIDSTNSEAKRLIKAGALDRLVIWTKQQTAGRGRYGRSWESGEGNLYMSTLLPIQCSMQDSAQLSFVMGLSIWEVVSNLAQKHKVKLPINLKWPNDILLGESKIGGILLESLPEIEDKWIVIGVGLNVEYTPNILGSSCLKTHGIKVQVGQILGMIMNSFDYYHNIWSLYGFTKIRQLWLKHAYKLGEVITINDTKSRVSGVFESIDKKGAIKIKLASGQTCSMSTGELFFGSNN